MGLKMIYQCLYCPFSTERKYNLKVHEERKHRRNIEFKEEVHEELDEESIRSLPKKKQARGQKKGELTPLSFITCLKLLLIGYEQFAASCARSPVTEIKEMFKEIDEQVRLKYTH